MKKSTLSAIMLTLAGCMPSFKNHGNKAFIAPPATTCLSARQQLLALDLETFDQAPHGLRSVYAKRPSCKLAAAELIKEYRVLHPAALKEFNSYLLYWHEGQLRAETGDYQSASELFEKAKMGEGVNEEVRVMWNLYVEATKAFVQRDRERLMFLRRQLATVPAEYLRGLKSPSNLNVVDGLVQCFELAYSEAYLTCRAQR